MALLSVIRRWALTRPACRERTLNAFGGRGYSAETVNNDGHEIYRKPQMTPADLVFAQYRRELDELIQQYVSSSTFYGPAIPLIQTRKLIKLMSRQNFSLKDKRFIDLGCGASRPLIPSVIGYLLGAKECLAIDIAEPFDLPSTALGIHSLIVAAVTGCADLDLVDGV